jgi:transposase
MAKRLNKTKMEVKGKVVNIGIDVHKRSWHATAIVEGVIVLSVSSFPAYEAFKKLLVRFKGATIRVAYEAGPAGFELYDRLTADGIECIVTPPSLIPTESGNRVKTDKIDSRKLAKLLEGNMLKKVWVLSSEQRAHRQLFRTRRQICNHRADVMRQIKSFLLFHGIRTPHTDNRNWTLSFINWLHDLDLGNAYLNRSLKALLELFNYLTEEKKRLTQEVGKLSRTGKYVHKVQLLLSIPGVGVLSAMEILVELQDMNRFKRADEVAAYLGLTPSQYSSGERIRMGHITHTGNRIVRTTLVECSWFLIAKDPWMFEKYHKIKIRRGGKKAIVAIARKLSIRIRRMLLDGVPYRIAQPKIA